MLLGLLTSTLLVREILRQVKDMDPPGRFLRKVSSNGPTLVDVTTFVEVTKREAREKVCQTLRDAVSEACRDGTANSEGAGAAGVESQANADEDDDEEASQMPALLTDIQLRTTLEDPRYHECFDYQSFPAEVLPLEMDNDFASNSPRKTTPSATPATVTPTNQTSEVGSDFAPFTSPNKSEDVSLALEYDAYNYLSRVGIEDDFDLFDGELLRTAKYDEVFASVDLLE